MSHTAERSDADPVHQAIVFLRNAGLAGADETPRATPLTGGVSSDVWRIDLADGPVCVKRALSKLRVEADWHAPVERNAFEAEWMITANAIRPGVAPRILARDDAEGLFAMDYLAPENHPVWKAELRAGHADPALAAAVGRALRQVHQATAGDATVARRFATDETFFSIRLEPYLIATGRAHPDLADRLTALADETAATRQALVHGDVSPKNILVGPDGPVLIDAECAWYGDPAFDLAFCLNHMLLKCLWVPQTAPRFLACFDALIAAYAPDAEVTARTAALLPALFLARVDGKSPVEYLTEDAQRDRVRRIARPFIARPPAEPDALRDAWQQEISS